MENEKTIAGLLCVIVILLIAGILMFTTFAKEDSNLAIPHKSISAGDSVAVKLTDSNGNPISNETVNIKLTDKSGKTIDKDVKTNSKGRAKLNVANAGVYTIECKFDGNSKYSSTSADANLSVTKAKTKSVDSSKTTSSKPDSGLSGDGYSYYPEYGPEVDSSGTTREKAIANNWNYIPQTIDGRDAGMYVPYDSKAGCYHT